MRANGYDPGRALDALNALDPGMARDDWVRAGMAAKAAGLSLDDFDGWSQGGSSYRKADVAATWRSIRPDGGVTEATLFAMARAAGWHDPERRHNGHHAPQFERHDRAHAHRDETPPRPDKSILGLWERLEQATEAHGYISAKRGRPDGLRVVPQDDPLAIAGQRVVGWLAVPARSLSGELRTLQFIPPPGQGKKLNLPGAAFEDGLFVVGDLTESDRIYIVEGIGQAWACWSATGCPAVVCFGAGRMATVAEILRRAYPDRRLVLVPDRGKEAQAASIAKVVRGEWMEMPEDKPSNYDCNDYAAEHGADELEALLHQTKIPEPAPEPGFRLLVRAGDLVKLPARVDWLLRGILERECLALLFGDPGTAKSFTALAWAVAIAAGREWQGHRVTQGPVAYIAGEGHAGLARRLKALEVHHGMSLADAPLFVSRRAVAMLDAVAVDALVEELDRLPAPPVLIVIDTLARALAGGEENSAADIGAFVAALDRLKSCYKAAVLVVHHAGHGDKSRARGSSALRAAVDVEMGLSWLPDAPEVLALACTKAKDGEPFKTLYFELQGVALPWADDDGEPINSAVLVASSYVPSEQPRKPNRMDGMLAKAIELAGTNSREQARAFFYKLHDGDDDAKRRAFNRAWRKYFDAVSSEPEVGHGI
jgi:hypothetical protein